MPTCQGKTKDGHLCSIRVKDGTQYCRWHKPEDEASVRLLDAAEDPFREAIRLIANAPRRDLPSIILLLNEEHPEEGWELLKSSLGRADLKGVDFRKVNLQGENLAIANLQDAKLMEANLQDSKLPLANLQNANLSMANLQSADLSMANLQNSTLLMSNLQGARLRSADLENAYLVSANLQSADVTEANLQGARLTQANLQDACLEGANLQGINLQATNLQRADLRRAKLQGVDLSQATITHIYIRGAWLDRTRLRWEQLGGAIGEELDSNYEEAKQGYLALKQNFDELGDYDAASWAYRKERRMEKLEALQKAKAALTERKWWSAIANGAKVAGDQAVELLCDYGESVWRVIASMAVLLFVIGPSLLDLLGGLRWTETTRDTYFGLPDFWQRWAYAYFQHILYMMDTFTTADFAELQPANDLVRLFSGFMAIIGIFLAGLLGFVAGNRIRRS